MCFMFSIVFSVACACSLARVFSATRGVLSTDRAYYRMLTTTFWTWLIPSVPAGGELSVAIGSFDDFTYVLGAHGYGACCGRFGVG